MNTIDLPLVTVIIPTYNRSISLKIAIDSVLNQSYKNIEINIYDDASSDDTYDICMNYKFLFSNFNYFQNKNNLGTIDNFIKSSKEISGDFLLFLGDDDYLKRNYIESCINFLQINHDFSCVKGNTVWIDRSEQKLYKNYDLISESNFFRVLKYYRNPVLYTVLYGLIRKKDFYTTRFTSKFPFDWHYEASIISLGKYKTIQSTNIYRSAHGASSNSNDLYTQLKLTGYYKYFSLIILCFNASMEIFKNDKVYSKNNVFKIVLLSFTLFIQNTLIHIFFYNLKLLRFKILIFLIGEKNYTIFKGYYYKLFNISDNE